MPEQFTDLVRIAGITILITLLWAVSVAFTYWDMHRQQLTGGKAFLWVAVVALLPFIGFILYLLFRGLTRILPSRIDGMDPKTRRETALKPSPARRSPLSTLLASDLEIQTIADPKYLAQASAGQPGNAPKFVFEISAGADQGKRFTIESLPALIGRGSEASIRLDRDIGVSRKHAELYERGGSLRIRDLHSKHGTQVNGGRIEDTTLQPDDRIQIGLTVLVLKTIEG
jgi:hypothetical protein